MTAASYPGDTEIPRRTINLSESTEAAVRELAVEGESFSATMSRLIEAGARSSRGPQAPSYAEAGDGPEDLGRLAERYLCELTEGS